MAKRQLSRGGLFALDGPVEEMFNIRQEGGGCYAKMIDITSEREPEIYSTTSRFGTILENVIVDPDTRVPDFTDDTITRNTRGSYPLHYIPNASTTGQPPTRPTSFS